MSHFNFGKRPFKSPPPPLTREGKRVPRLLRQALTLRSKKMKVTLPRTKA